MTTYVVIEFYEQCITLATLLFIFTTKCQKCYAKTFLYKLNNYIMKLILKNIPIEALSCVEAIGHVAQPPKIDCSIHSAFGR